VLYEMLTGKMAFSGEAVTDTLAAVIRAEPDWSQLPAYTPMRVRVLLQRCLQKDAKQRLRDIGDARISLEEVLSGASELSPGAAPTPSPRFWRRLLPWAVGVLAVAVAVAATWHLKPSPPRPVTRFTITLPSGQHLAGLDQPALALSPDGSQLAYVATTQGGVQQIYLREMNSAETRSISGTEGATDPFFSPDGQWLGFFADGRLKKIPVSGGAAITLADAPAHFGASWGSQGIIVFISALGPLQQVSDAGGVPQPLTRLEKGELAHAWPEFLLGSKALVFEGREGIAVQPVGTGERRNLIQGGSSPGYSSSGHLVYAQTGNLMAVPFDLQRLTVTGAAVPIVEGIFSQPAQISFTQYSISLSGSLVYISGGAQTGGSNLVWVSRNGTGQSVAAPERGYGFPRLSPDGRRIAVSADGQIWLYDLSRETLTRFTFAGTANYLPVWTPDGKRIAFYSSKEGTPNIFWQLADGSGGLERLTTSTYTNAPLSFSPDGQMLAFDEASPTGIGIWVLRMSDRKAQPFLRTQFKEAAARFSPDGHWLAYVSNESGRDEVYAQPYPGPGGKWQISTDGGTEPLWNRSGRELFYRSGDKLMAVGISTQPGFVAGKPRQLFKGGYLLSSFGVPNYDVSPDGQRFLMVKPVGQEQAVPTQINVVLNWTEELKRLVPTGK
jgi:serine/threonine-protein kinase